MLRIGLHLIPAEPYWVQAQEAFHQIATQQNLRYIPIDRLIDNPPPPGIEEEILALDLDVLITMGLPESLATALLDDGLPIISLTESSIRHPLLTAPLGLYDNGCLVSQYVAEQLAGRGAILVLGGLVNGADDGTSRLQGIFATLAAFPAIQVTHVPSPWGYEPCCEAIKPVFSQLREPFAALIGLSDPVALAGRDLGLHYGIIDQHALVAGINGDPLALAAIAAGTMVATVETLPGALVAEAIRLAHAAGAGKTLPAHFAYQSKLVTAANVAEVAMEKLIALADLPNRLVGVNRRQEQQRLTQLEASLEINRRAGSLLSRQQLSHELIELIRTTYGYDGAQVVLWRVADQALMLDSTGAEASPQLLSPLGVTSPLEYALHHNELVVIPDTQRNYRFSPDPRWPAIRSRAVVPLRRGEQVIGVLDLQGQQVSHHGREDLVGLQSLADQVSLVIHNAELYQAALSARSAAEQASRLKTHLLANVSHELRTPLNIMIGYSDTLLTQSARAVAPDWAAVRPDLQQIIQSGEQLSSLIDDLLDYARAEADALELQPESIDIQLFCGELFAAYLAHVPQHSGLRWQLDLVEPLPMVYADPLRLRQVIYNLLSNAQKFTERGSITLGARAEANWLHLWVADTGCGITPTDQRDIFEPFLSLGAGGRNQRGIGLGLSIVRRIVDLHQGRIDLASTPGLGTTVHVYLPLDAAADPPAETAIETAIEAAMIHRIEKPLTAHMVTQVLGKVPHPGRQPILIVDDDPHLSMLYARLLTERLPELTTVVLPSGTAALQWLAEHTPSLILLDLMMPEVDGFAVVRAVRSEPRTQHVPIVLLSGKLLTSEDVAQLPGPRVTLLTKGMLSDDEMARQVQRALRHEGRLAAATSSLVKAAVAYMHQQYASNLTRGDIAAAIGVSEDYLGRIFQQEMGLSPLDYLNRYRVLQAKIVLDQRDVSITDLAEQLGFESLSHFSRTFRKYTGRSPRAYRERSGES
jgi:signal transduction histidine kinase/AraC-like DNA-binding protein